MVKTTGVPSGRISPSSEISRQNAVRAPRTKVLAARGEFAPSPGLHGRFVYETAQPRVLRMRDEATRTSSYSSMPSGPASSERVSEDMPSRNHTPHPPFPSTPPRRHGLHSTPQDNTHL
ncbi:uncharacterized protein VDAG_04601 [Verticillium dahliae VdLs.17]|uniref:Uncharacterized protein n=1 Tax=Verticillium dahliae (strain VdLs.17 / ATCC MYA-4575 / FGSC 10137) TaxID=498257 RepID=G2X3L4_VERDV|nr:uncharacterized protein VDAG_04601 [Verticillium dahliae VdLs.17]EGY23163.1 hypothetical protein VDAG_04601 [Verticillium dahliae VdLs.17]